MAARSAQLMTALALFLFECGKNHATSSGLEDAGYRGFHLLTKMPAGILNHHHGAIVQVGNALPLLFALPHNLQVKHLAR